MGLLMTAVNYCKPSSESGRIPEYRQAHQQYNKLTKTLHLLAMEIENKQLKGRTSSSDSNIKLHFEVSK